VDLAAQQIDPGELGDSAVAFVLVIAREGRMHARQGRQVRCRRADRRGTRLLVTGNNRHGIARRPLLQKPDLALDPQHLRHLFAELIPALQAMAHLMRLDFLRIEDRADGALRSSMCDQRPTYACVPAPPGPPSSTPPADSRTPSPGGGRDRPAQTALPRPSPAPVPGLGLSSRAAAGMPYVSVRSTQRCTIW
jgi:hypothetical protein